MNDDSPDEESPESESEKEPNDTVESLAQRAQEMLRRVSGESAEGWTVGGKIVGAAGGLGVPPDRTTESETPEIPGAPSEIPAAPVETPETPAAPEETASAAPPPTDRGGTGTGIISGLTGRVAGAVSGLRSTPSQPSEDRPPATIAGAAPTPVPESPPPPADIPTPSIEAPTQSNETYGPAAVSGAADGGSGGRFEGGGGDGDDDRLFAEIPISGDWQLVLLGLIITGLFFFGGDVWDAITNDTTPDRVVDRVLATDANADRFSSSTSTIAFQPQDTIVVVLAEAAPTTTIAASTTVAAPTTTLAAITTVATTTTAAPTTTAVAVAYTMWDALEQSGETERFASLAQNIGLRAELEALTDADGNPIERTLFAPSDDAISLISSADLAALTADPDGAGAVVRYHLVEGRLTQADLSADDATGIETLSGLPLTVAVDGSDLVLNDTSRVVVADIESDNGVVHIIDVLLRPPTVNQVLDLGDIEFEVGSDVITASGEAELARAVEFFAVNSNITATIEGHTDTDGSSLGNQELSERRATAVKNFLVENGLDGDRFTTEGFGETRPIIEDGVENKAASRRIEFVVS